MRHLNALVLSFFVAASAAAQSQLGPEELVKKVTADVLDTIKSDKGLQAGDRQKALALAEQKVLPHIDFREAMILAMGRSWHQAKPAQQEELVSAFRTMLVRIYANAIDRYRGQTMKVMPVRMPAGATEVAVRNRYLSPGRPPVPIEYSMRKGPEGWKIYDISVEGVSLVLTYRAEFENITRTSGVEGLIKRLQEKNA
ncbi:MAG: ABC transporter substrate-binding protein [Betaproteobacteria bacterium]|nr:ABC transporter substrate-binding protein [Betaproteobacteria bacterium]